MRRGFSLLIGALAAFGCSDPSPTTGTLTVHITGLPVGALALVRITGPDNFLRTLNATATIEDLAPGDYVVEMDTIVHNNTKYGVPVIQDTIQVTRGGTLTADVPYSISSGSLDLTISGLPAGTPGDVKIIGPAFSSGAMLSGVIPGLAPGKYYIQSDTFTTVQGDRFGSPRTLDSVNVIASATPATASVAYTLVSGMLALTVNGLPAGFSQQPITVTGPNGYSGKFSGTTTVRGLSAGTYSVTAQTANGTCPAIYRTSATPQNVGVAIGATASATVNYAAGTADPADLNLKIESVHVIQVTQNAQWSVPMVAGRSALVRVFGVANQCNTVVPKVRLTIGGTTLTQTAPESSVRSLADESTLTSSWNFNVPGNLVQQGMSVIAEIDYDLAVSETNELDNRYPASGSRSVIVKSVPTIGVRFVPIAQTVNGTVLTGGIAGNVDGFMDFPRRVHPIAAFEVSVRDTYTTSAGPLASSGANWVQVLNEIDALRESDPTANSLMFYYGVAKANYVFGTDGIAFAPGNAALGLDKLPRGSEVVAHELGHSFGRLHSPCGGPAPSSIDQAYPSSQLYSGARIGAYGYDQTAQTLKSPAGYVDIMSYCSPYWISDYNYVGMLTYLSNLGASAASVSSVSRMQQPSLLVWGRIENGVPILEPAFEMDAVPAMPTSAGPSRITAMDASGAEVLSFSFAGKRIADLPGDNETFSFVVPRSALKGRSIATLRLSARGRTSTNVASAVVDADPGVVATRPAAGRVRLRWDAGRYPVLMVRNRTTGNVIAFARGGDATVAASQDEVEINASNRVGSARRTVRVLK